MTLRERVIAFVSEQCGVGENIVTTETTLFGDLGVDGQDGVEFLQAFGQTFAVDLKNCNPRQYFGPEGLWPWFPIRWIVLALRHGSPEQRSRLQSIRVADLVQSAEAGRWTIAGSD
jgi:acyl carrier protein